MDFQNVKKQILERGDNSRKGSIDDSISEYVNFINSRDEYVTTSSCSGRALLYTTGFEASSGPKKSKKDCKWLFSSHDIIDVDEFLSKVDPSEGDLIFKFDPFIFHVLCADVESACKMLEAAILSGYKDSGLIFNKKGKVTLAIRGSLRLEVPISQSGVMLVSEIYLKYLIEVANEKMKTNKAGMEEFFGNLKDIFKERRRETRIVSRRFY